MQLRVKFKSLVITLGEFTLFGGEIFASLPRLWKRRGLFLKQCEFIGVSSLGVTSVAAIFLGAVMGYQLYVSFHIFGAEAFLGGSIGAALLRELAPVMTAVMVTGRAGAAMAAEIASMKVSEQIDALEVMAVDPIDYLVTPRVLAGVLMLPLLATVFSFVGSLAGAAVGCGLMGLETTVFWSQYAKVVDAMDLVHCVIKGSVFGLVMTWVACFCGFRAKGGARGVGFATRTTVVSSFLTVLFTDYLLTSLLPYGLAKLKVL